MKKTDSRIDTSTDARADSLTAYCLLHLIDGTGIKKLKLIMKKKYKNSKTNKGLTKNYYNS